MGVDQGRVTQAHGMAAVGNVDAGVSSIINQL